MKLIKKLGMVNVLLLMSMLSVGCGSKEKDELTENDVGKKEEVFECKYKETSEISMFAYDNITKYSKEYTDCQLYEWSDDVVLPIPAPDENINVTVAESVIVNDIHREVWEEYVSVLSDKYIIESEIIEVESNYKQNISIFDMENNYTATMSWNENEHSMYVYVYMFCQEKEMSVSNGEVADMVAKKLGKSCDTIKAVINASSNSNLSKSFEVFYIYNNVEASDNPKTYICVVKDKEIVYLEADKILVSLTDEIEFAKKGNDWYMYILKQDFCSGFQVIEEFVLKDGEFESAKIINVEEMDIVKESEYSLVTLETTGEDVIELYGIKRSDNSSVIFEKHDRLGELK